MTATVENLFGSDWKEEERAFPWENVCFSSSKKNCYANQKIPTEQYLTVIFKFKKFHH
jgi:hypothetical protein